jgi:hypothetical protein
MNEPCMVVKCERCGSECRLMYNSVRSNTILCPVCMENEIDCCLFSPDTQAYHETDDIMHNSYMYVTDFAMLSTN